MDILQTIPGIGPKTKKLLEKLQIYSAKDLLYHFPSRYLDFSQTKNISDLIVNDVATIKAQVISFVNLKTRRGISMQKIMVSDSSGQIQIIFFNQDYLRSTLKIGDKYSFAGTIGSFSGKLCLTSPEYGDLHTGKIVPIYPQTAGLSSKLLRKLITQTLSLYKLPDLPDPIRTKHHLEPINDSLLNMHFPANYDKLETSQQDLAIREILELQLRSMYLKQSWDKRRVQKVLIYKKDQEQKIISSLSFELTPSQAIAWEEIKTDIFSTKKPANRLLEGDVGSGKTVLALLCCTQALANSTTSVIVAPTEILAMQHYQKFSTSVDSKDLLLLTGSKKAKPDNNPKIIITTHAIFFKDEALLQKISLVVIDEQHKFGVAQRSYFETKDTSPHILTMTATPIPRTVNLALLGHLDISTLSLPPGRLPVKTYIVPQQKQSDCWNWVDTQISSHKSQAYVVTPLIESSEILDTLSAAQTTYTDLREKLPNQSIALLHGKQRSAEKEKIMADFKDNKTNILVSTPVIEVGVDVPNATIMVILSPERFGLAQLHQLRGRVGRGQSQSYCYLFTNSALSRLQVFAKTNSGHDLAQFDLENRGAGEIFGTLQHGFATSKLAKTSDLELIKKAQKILVDLKPYLSKKDNLLREITQVALN